MEAIDKMEYDPNNPPPYSVKVLQDKRRKLKETWLKIYQFYQREDPPQAHTIKRMEQEYEQRRMSMMMIYESVMQAQRVKLDDIPLPDDIMPPGDIDLPTMIEPLAAPKSILKLVSSCYDTDTKQPPGPPPGTPPPLAEFECDADEFELGLTLDESYKSQEKPKKIRFDNSQPMLQQPAPPPVTASTIQQSLLNKAYSNMNRVPPPSSQAGGYQRAGHQPPPPPPPRPQQGQQGFNQPNKPTEVVSKPAVQIQAQPVLRNKLAEVTRFVPTSLSVKRDNKKPVQASQSFMPQQTMSSQSGGKSVHIFEKTCTVGKLNLF